MKFKKSCNLILAYNLRTKFSPDIQFLQNHIDNYGASFKVQKVMLPLLKSQIFCFWSKFVLLTQLSRQQIQFPKFTQKIRKIHWVDPEKNALQTDVQKDIWTDEQNWFYRAPFAKMEVWSSFSKMIFISFCYLERVHNNTEFSWCESQTTTH